MGTPGRRHKTSDCNDRRCRRDSEHSEERSVRPDPLRRAGKCRWVADRVPVRVRRGRAAQGSLAPSDPRLTLDVAALEEIPLVHPTADKSRKE